MVKFEQKCDAIPLKIILLSYSVQIKPKYATPQG